MTQDALEDRIAELVEEIEAKRAEIARLLEYRRSRIGLAAAERLTNQHPVADAYQGDNT